MDYAGLAAGGMPAEWLAEVFLEKEKDRYKDALAAAGRTGNCGELFCMFCKQMLASFAMLTDVAM